MAGMGAALTRVVRAPGGYLSVYLVGVLLTATMVRIVQRDFEADAIPLAALTSLVTVVLALVLWMRDPLPGLRTGLLPWFLVALLALWVYQVVLNVMRNEDLRIPALMLPIMIALVAYRTPVGTDATRVSDVFAWAVIVFSAVTLVLESVGVVPHWTITDSASMIVNERASYFLPLADLVGIQGRWSGPFVHPNLAGPVGGFLLVFGATRRGLNRIAFVSSGIVILLLTASRSALVAAVVGLVLLAAVSWINRPSGLTRRTRVLITALPALVVATAVIVVNPGFSGRTSMWPQVVDLWRATPLLGIGDGGFERAIDDGTLPVWAIHAHNVILDAGVRTGVVGFAIAVTVLALASVLAVAAARRGEGVALALVGMLLVASMTDAIIVWRYLTGTLIVLVLAALMSVRRGAASGAPGTPPPPAQEPGSDQAPDPALTL